MHTCHVLCSYIHFVQGIGDMNLAYQCFKLCVTYDNNHAEAYNNLGVLEWKRERGEQVRAV